MQYKSIVLELLEQYPAGRDRIRGRRSLLETLNTLSAELKESHLAWMERLRESRPGSDGSQIASEALEIALAELAERLSDASEADPEADDGSEVFSLDGAMAFIRRHTPPK